MDFQRITWFTHIQSNLISIIMESRGENENVFTDNSYSTRMKYNFVVIKKTEMILKLTLAHDRFY